MFVIFEEDFGKSEDAEAGLCQFERSLLESIPCEGGRTMGENPFRGPFDDNQTIPRDTMRRSAELGFAFERDLTLLRCLGQDARAADPQLLSQHQQRYIDRIPTPSPAIDRGTILRHCRATTRCCVTAQF